MTRLFIFCLTLFISLCQEPDTPHYKAELDPPYVKQPHDVSELTLMRITCYLPTGNKTASGVYPYIGGCAGRREDIGKVADIYTIDGWYIGSYDINDCGSHYMLRNGTALDIYRENMDQAWEWVGKYGDHMYVKIREKNEPLNGKGGNENEESN